MPEGPPATTSWPARLERAKPALACPECCRPLVFSAEGGHCGVCGGRYPLRNGKLYFIAPPHAGDELDALKGRLKRWLGRLYYTVGITVVAPTFPFDFAAAVRRHVDPTKALVVEIGCGTHRADADVLGLDMMDYGDVDIVCDLQRLPFLPGSVDAFVSRSVLEHVPDMPEVVERLKTCTRPGGLALHLIPFLFPFHASPEDYWRLTWRGAATLFKGWEVIEQRNATGPVTLFLVSLIEFLSILLSAGRERLKAHVYLLLCLLLFPIKFLDWPFIGRPSMLTLAPTIFTVARRP